MTKMRKKGAQDDWSCCYEQCLHPLHDHHHHHQSSAVADGRYSRVKGQWEHNRSYFYFAVGGEKKDG